MKSTLKRIIKTTIFVAVVVGLLYSLQKASVQWETQTRLIQTSLDEIDQAISNATENSEREQLKSKRRELQQNLPTLANLNWKNLALAAVTYAFGLLPAGVLLHLAVTSFGHRPNLSTSIAAHLLGHVGKYVPGKALVVILRAGTLARSGVPLRDATVSIFMETLMMMAVGGAISTFVVIWLPLPSWIIGLSLLAALASSLPTFPPIMHWLSKKVVKGKQSDNQKKLSDEREGSGWRLFLTGWILQLSTWVLIGLSFTLVIVAIPTSDPLPTPIQLYAISTAAISLAVVTGFASLLPGGAGVRELVLATVLGIMLSPAHGLIAAILVRLVHLSVEASCAGLSWIWLRSRSL